MGAQASRRFESSRFRQASLSDGNAQRFWRSEGNRKRELALGFLLTEERAETKSPSLVDSLTTLSTEDYSSSRFRRYLAVVHKK